jgi:hypothetical protein
VSTVIEIQLKDVKYSSFIKSDFLETRKDELFEWFALSTVYKKALDIKRISVFIMKTLEKDFISLIPSSELKGTSELYTLNDIIFSLNKAPIVKQKPDKYALFNFFFPQVRNALINRKRTWVRCLYLYLYDMIKTAVLRDSEDHIKELNNQLITGLDKIACLPKGYVTDVWRLKDGRVQVWTELENSLTVVEDVISDSITILSPISKKQKDINEGIANSIFRQFIRDLWNIMLEMRGIQTIVSITKFKRLRDTLEDLLKSLSESYFESIAINYTVTFVDQKKWDRLFEKFFPSVMIKGNLRQNHWIKTTYLDEWNKILANNSTEVENIRDILKIFFQGIEALPNCTFYYTVWRKENDKFLTVRKLNKF